MAFAYVRHVVSSRSHGDQRDVALGGIHPGGGVGFGRLWRGPPSVGPGDFDSAGDMAEFCFGGPAHARIFLALGRGPGCDPCGVPHGERWRSGHGRGMWTFSISDGASGRDWRVDGGHPFGRVVEFLGSPCLGRGGRGRGSWAGQRLGSVGRTGEAFDTGDVWIHAANGARLGPDKRAGLEDRVQLDRVTIVSRDAEGLPSSDISARRIDILVYAADGNRPRELELRMRDAVMSRPEDGVLASIADPKPIRMYDPEDPRRRRAKVQTSSELTCVGWKSLTVLPR